MASIGNIQVPFRRDFFLSHIYSMKRKTTKSIVKWLSGLVTVYLLVGLLTYFFQDSLLFHPQPVAKDYHYPFEQSFEELNLPHDGNNLNIIKFQPEESRKGIVLFFHGNMNNVYHYSKYVDIFLRNGYALWMIDYPGFGKTTGKRTEAILYEQAEVMYTLAVKVASADSLVIYGKSIGTGVASYLASKAPCRRLILETPYRSIHAVASHYFPMYPVRRMIRYHLPTEQYLHRVGAPVSAIHGTNDRVIPYVESVKLKEAHPTMQLITVAEGGHNNLSEYKNFQSAIDSLLNAPGSLVK